jgi:hypothetical protein
MDINKMTIGEAKEIAQLFNSQQSQPEHGPWVIGEKYHIRTVTHYWTGRLINVYPQELVLEDACWIPDTGRFSDFFTNGPNEAEPIDGYAIIGRGAVVDAQLWQIQLPRLQK